MKPIKLITVTILATTLLVAPFAGLTADDKDAKSAKKAKPYTLTTCPVSDEKLDSDPDMKPYVFTYGDREIKLCCKSCKKDFDKDPAKFVKKVEDAEKKAKKS